MWNEEYACRPIQHRECVNDAINVVWYASNFHIQLHHIRYWEILAYILGNTFVMFLGKISQQTDTTCNHYQNDVIVEEHGSVI